MAGLFDFQYEGSRTPDAVRRALEAEKAYRAAQAAKLPIAVEGSGVPEGVRKAAQAAIEKGAMPRIPNAPVVDPGAWAASAAEGGGSGGTGLFGKTGAMLAKGAGILGRAVGPVAYGYDGLQSLNKKFGPEAYGNIATAVEEGQTRQAMVADPELANRGQETANRVAGNAMQGTAGLLPQYQEGAQSDTQMARDGAGLLMYKPEAGQQQSQLSPDELSAIDPNNPPDQAPQQSPMEVPNPAPQATSVQPPQNVPQAFQKAKVQQEAERQAVQQDLQKKLSSGDISRHDAAKQVVKADLAREQKVVTPEKEKELVAAEATNMKTMGDSDLSKYVSYALMVGGIASIFLDKSGQAGKGFTGAFLQAQQQKAAANAAAIKARAEYSKEQRKEALERDKLKETSRRNGIYEVATNNTGEYQAQSIGVKKEGLLVQKENKATDVAIAKARMASADNRAAASNSLARDRFDQAERHFQANQDFKSEDLKLDRSKFESDEAYKAATLTDKRNNTLIRAKVATAAAGNKGIELSTKDAADVVDKTLESQGLNVDAGAKAALAQTVRSEMKNNPEAAKDPVGTVARILSEQADRYESSPGGSWLNGSTKVKKLKLQ